MIRLEFKRSTRINLQLCLWFLLVILFAPALLIAEELPIYPGKTISYGSEFTAGVLFPLQEDWDSGGSIQAGFYFNDLLPSFQFGVMGGYNYILDSGAPRLFSNAGISGSYSFPFFDTFSLNPEAGFSIAFPHNFGDADFIPVIEAGLETRLQLSQRNFLSLETVFRYPIGGELPLQAVFGGRLSRFTPVKIEMDPVEVEFAVGPEKFSPDNDGDNDLLDMEMWTRNGDLIAEWEIHIFDEFEVEVRHWSGETQPPLQVRWDGLTNAGEKVGSALEYRIDIDMKDILGNTFSYSREIMTDILVRKVGGKYKIMIPNIVFPPNSANFALLPDEDISRNTEIIRKIAVKLDKYPDYNVRIEGHGNLDYWEDPVEAAREQEEILIPLTEARAEMIREVLVESGVDPDRLQTEGVGASDPLVPFSDQENRWKNRRVEFVLLK